MYGFRQRSLFPRHARLPLFAGLLLCLSAAPAAR